MSAPKRLLEDPETAAALRNDLHAVASHQVDFDLAAGLARFEASLAAGSAVAAAGVKPGLSLLKLGMAGIVAGGAIVGVAVFAGGKSGNETPAKALSAPALSPVTSPVPPTAAPTPAPAAPSTDAAAPTSSVTQEPSASQRRVPAPGRATARPTQQAAQQTPAPTAESRDDLLLREVQQLRQIRQLVNASPSQALALANEGHATFKGGVLYQEREALALQALSALGRRSELEARGERYLRTFPNGSFSARVRQLLGR